MSQTATGPAERPYGRFFLPGPTEVHPEVRAAQKRPMMSQRGVNSPAFMRGVQDDLQEVFCTKRPVFIATSSATGLMEAAVRNAGRTKILSLTNGAFSERFAAIGRACGLEVDTYQVAWGETHDPDVLRAHLENGVYDAVTMAHSETSTGVLNDIQALATVVHDFPDTLVLVDSVTGFGAVELRPDDWGIDFVLTGSQKAFALPPGLSFGVPSARMMERAKEAPYRGYYFDLLLFQQNHEKDQSPTTPALSVLYSLEVQLTRMLAEGMEARWARHAEMAQRTWDWVDEMRGAGIPLQVMAPEGHRSPSVTTVLLPDGVSGPDVTDSVVDRGWLVGGGYGKLKSTTLRVGHMGDHTMDELNGLLAVLTGVLS